jgi:hypothetical protein
MTKPVAERSKTRVCGQSLDGVAGSDPAGGMDVCDVSKRQTVKCRTVKTKQPVQMKYRESTKE